MLSRDAVASAVRAGVGALLAMAMLRGVRFPRQLETMLTHMPGLLSWTFAPHIGAAALTLCAASARSAARASGRLPLLLDAVAALISLRAASLALLSFRRSLAGRTAFHEAAAVLPQPSARQTGGMGVSRAVRSAVAIPVAEWMGLRITRGVEFANVAGVSLRLDIYQPPSLADSGGPVPTLLYFHGGGWMTGDKSVHSLPLLMRAARMGWRVLTANYRLSTVDVRAAKAGGATFPDHLHDCLRAVAWARSGAPGRPESSVLVIGGESAGGHLACLVALAGSSPRMRPEELRQRDLSVDGVIDLYGVHNPRDTDGHFEAMEKGRVGFRKFFSGVVLKSKEERAWEDSSPMWWLEKHRSAAPPPFLVVHGTHDGLVPVDDSRTFVAALSGLRAAQTAASRVPDVYVEVPWAPHAFNMVNSPLTYALNDTVCRFLSAVLASATVKPSL